MSTVLVLMWYEYNLDMGIIVINVFNLPPINPTGNMKAIEGA